MIKVNFQLSVEKIGFFNTRFVKSRQYNRKTLNWIHLLYYIPRYSTNVPMIKCKVSNQKVKVREENICAFSYNFEVEKPF